MSMGTQLFGSQKLVTIKFCFFDTAITMNMGMSLVVLGGNTAVSYMVVLATIMVQVSSSNLEDGDEV